MPCDCQQVVENSQLLQATANGFWRVRIVGFWIKRFDSSVLANSGVLSTPGVSWKNRRSSTFPFNCPNSRTKWTLSMESIAANRPGRHIRTHWKPIRKRLSSLLESVYWNERKESNKRALFRVHSESSLDSIPHLLWIHSASTWNPFGRLYRSG